MIWWIGLPGRARAEMAALAELQERSDWLFDVSWSLDSTRLAANFTIRHLEDDYPLRLVYPSFFPDTPPQVLPRENVRLSQHQWGTGGELCLELRADNWDPAYTGAMMVESARNLLSGERPAVDEAAVVPSAHHTSLAQSIRGDKLRLLLTAEERDALHALPVAEATELTLAEHDSNGNWLIHPVRLGIEASPKWVTPQRTVDAKLRRGFAIRMPVGEPVPGRLDAEGLRTLLISVGADHVAAKVGVEPGEFYVLFVGDISFKLFCAFRGQQNATVLSYTTVVFPESQNRLQQNYTALTDKGVALVGCGSLGSKIATSLARSGLRKFTLIDEDILNPDNIVRHDLDARSVGMHKVDALAARLLAVNISADIDMRRIKLGGQESAASTDSALKAIGASDLVIDASADPHVFNLCALAARSERKPMIWGEVFAGGIGGLIARVRPAFDPPPHAARRQLLAWCDMQGVPWTGGRAAPYAADMPDALPVIADDAEVSVIASHMTRFALDTLLNGEDSQFPNPAYAIGLSRDWIFSAPFDVAPIAFSPEGVWGPDAEPDSAKQLAALAAELFPSEAEGADAA